MYCTDIPYKPASKTMILVYCARWHMQGICRHTHNLRGYVWLRQLGLQS